MKKSIKRAMASVREVLGRYRLHRGLDEIPPAVVMAEILERIRVNRSARRTERAIRRNSKR